MAFLGNTPSQQAFTPAVDYFNGTGSATAFTLSRPVASVAQVQVTIENVPQNPSSAFTVSGSTITFTSAPPSGTSNVYVTYTSPITQVIAPGQGTVNTTQLGSITTIPNGSATLTLPTTTDTLVGKATTDTLTNKTLTGAVFTAMPATTTAQSMVRLNTANGYGSTNTKIARFTTVTSTQGSDITYADSATLGASLTINTNGVYAMSYTSSFTSAASMGISLNTTVPTTGIESIPVAELLTYMTSSVANYGGCASVVAYLASGSIIRPQTDGASNAGTRVAVFTITRVA